MIELLMRRREMVEVDTIPYDAEIEYLEATGTQYIDTLLAYNGAWNVKAAVQNTDVRSSARDRRYFGGAQGFQNNGISFAENSFIYMKNNTACNTYNKSDVTYLSFVGGVLSVTGSVSVSKTIATNTSTAPVSITLFCEHRPNNSFLSFLTGRIYYFSLGTNEDANNILDMIPVRKNGVGYLYDKVSGTLFGNAGTGAFTIGPDKIYDTLIRSLTIANGQTPAIITDYYPNENTKVVCSCKLTERPSTSANKCLCGTFTYISNNLYRRFDVQFRNNLNVETNAGNGVSNKASVAYTVNTQINWEFGNGYIIKDGTRTSGTASSAFTADYPLVLFSNCNNGVPSISSTTAGGFVGVIYGNIYIYEGSTLMRCYHPAKKNERVGLWESVTNQMLFSSYGEFSE